MTQIPTSHKVWQMNSRYEQVETAAKARRWQSEFDDADPMDKAYLIAYYRTRAKMDAWERHMNEQEAERIRRSNQNR